MVKFVEIKNDFPKPVEVRLISVPPLTPSHRGTCGGLSRWSTTDRAAGCMQRVLEPFMFRMEAVPLSPSPTQRSVERDLGACKRLARCTAYRWRLHTIAVHSRHRATGTPRQVRSAGISLKYASSPTLCNTPLHTHWAAERSKISQPPHPLSHVK